MLRKQYLFFHLLDFLLQRYVFLRCLLELAKERGDVGGLIDVQKFHHVFYGVGGLFRLLVQLDQYFGYLLNGGCLLQVQFELFFFGLYTLRHYQLYYIYVLN